MRTVRWRSLMAEGGLVLLFAAGSTVLGCCWLAGLLSTFVFAIDGDLSAGLQALWFWWSVTAPPTVLVAAFVGMCREKRGARRPRELLEWHALPLCGAVLLGALTFAVARLAAAHEAPIALTVATLPDREGRHVATVEEVDTGLGFGLGQLNCEVHVGRQGEPETRHGDDSPTVVFYTPCNDARAYARAEWTGLRELTIRFRASDQGGGPRVGQVDDIVVRYVDEGLAPATN